MNRRTFLKASGLLAGSAALGGARASGGAVHGETVRLGVIGTGDRGSGLLHVVSQLEGFRVTACCDVLPFRLERGLALAGDGCRGLDDYRELLERRDVDAVVVATPLSLHHEMAAAALDAGKHVYCEKTMTYRIDEALDLVPRVARAGTVFQVGHQYRYLPLYERVAAMIREGYIGQVTNVTLQWNRNDDWRRPVPEGADAETERLINWRMYREYSGGLLAELSSHQIDYVNWIFDRRPRRVAGFGGIDYWQDGRETCDNVNVVLDYPGGMTVNAVCLTANAHDGYLMEFRGSRGTIEVRIDEARLYAERPNERETGIVDGVSGATRTAFSRGEGVAIVAQGSEPGWEGTHYALASFRRSILDGTEPSSSVRTGARTAIGVRLAIDAVREGGVHTWPEGVDAASG
jgi:predicted dehydrogenase